MESFIPFIFFGFIALMIVMIVVAVRQAAKRRQELAAWAAAHGLSYSDAKDSSFMQRFPAFDCLRAGDQNRYAYNIMTGKWREHEVIVFDYHYETESRDSKGNRRTSSHHFSGAILHSPLPLKPLFMRAEGFFDKIGEFLGFDDIDFESAEFSRKFCVKAADRKWAYDVLHQRAMEFLLSRPRRTIQFAGPHAMIHSGSRLTPAEMDEALGTLTGLLDMLPEYVRQQLRERV